MKKRDGKFGRGASPNLLKGIGKTSAFFCTQNTQVHSQETFHIFPKYAILIVIQEKIFQDTKGESVNPFPCLKVLPQQQ
ncbi:MAG: hypothetical protein COV59_01245 [Candidatus Magasanikbacteria bacterium CG11_big_fil_rev_8_21_14_0_20_39_34]|uniref:Uncharacterized protein n=1 Tax=Candidatus Magasanikbacteria bacterium CG11_big_fil_rev_8_21_14_0_20_39_34 TaxID=1974653 RepID=A0A2H0N634_9BACT|nr:MAG: hypothetical protein COV59_01245 [Candidatus Magasanikbacteria bacterium CG11_big_fil_rev_8_21_14_0_20_39_34]